MPAAPRAWQHWLRKTRFSRQVPRTARPSADPSLSRRSSCSCSLCLLPGAWDYLVLLSILGTQEHRR